MGMLLGHSQVENPGDTIEVLQPGTGRPVSDKVQVAMPLNTGIGVVLPISYIVEAVEQSFIREKREETIGKANQRRGFVPNSQQKMKHSRMRLVLVRGKAAILLRL